MNWAEFQAAAAELANEGRERLNRTGVALLGTLRRDGSPERDPRCVLHSSVSDPKGTEGEFKLYGRPSQ